MRDGLRTRWDRLTIRNGILPFLTKALAVTITPQISSAFWNQSLLISLFSFGLVATSRTVAMNMGRAKKWDYRPIVLIFQTFYPTMTPWGWIFWTMPRKYAGLTSNCSRCLDR